MRALREEAERLLERSASRRLLEPLLLRILDFAEQESDSALFAHHRLAEILLEHNPWRAALHLRTLGKNREDDPVVHALTGLCHVLLGNYRFATTSYEKALEQDPSNPWYHHNIGHLLDVALNRSKQAEEHLRLACESLPNNHEVLASLAHCLGRLGKLAEAKRLAKKAAKASAQHEEMLASLSALQPRENLDETQESSGSSERRRDAFIIEAAQNYLLREGWSPIDCAVAVEMWETYTDGRKIRMTKPEVGIAALVCAVMWYHGNERIGPSEVAKAYGVSARAVVSRLSAIRDAHIAAPDTEPVSLP